ncbi:hypothetical protein VTI74DRAFT_2498 [Chaetomium olivicolor]
MARPLLSSLITLLFLTSSISAHSHLAHILINGQLYHGFDPRPNQVNYPSRVTWSNAATDDGFVTPANYSHPDIICHTAGTSPPAHAPVRAGDKIHVQWNGWPIGHIGPVLSYLAPCNGTSGCTDVDKTALRWTKVDDSRPVMELAPDAKDPEQEGVPGQKWATDVLVAANNSWQVAVPEGLKTGAYVLRHEIIALHFAGRKGGAQNYPICVNLWVEGVDGGMVLDGFDARGFYKEEDPGVLVNVTAGLTQYVVPGPTVAVGATPIPYTLQQPSALMAEGTPVVVTRGTATTPFVATPTGVVKRGKYDRRD